MQVCLQHMESLLYGPDYIIKFPDVQFLAFIKARQQDIFSMELSSLSSLVLSAFPGHGSSNLVLSCPLIGKGNVCMPAHTWSVPWHPVRHYPP